MKIRIKSCATCALLLVAFLFLPACSDLVKPIFGGDNCQAENPIPSPTSEGELPAPDAGESPGSGEAEDTDDGDSGEDPDAPQSVAFYSYRVINQYPHDPNAFTQGLQYVDGELFESTGIRGQSTLRRVALETGEVLQMIDLDSKYFGEGLTVWGGHIYQLTWQRQTGFIYDKDTFELVREFSYPTEGWGLTHDGSRLIMSDGTAKLYFLDPNSLTRTGEVTVHSGAGPINQINELEYIKGEVYANVWKTDNILIINPETGRVTGVADLAGILPHEVRTGGEDVLNGIAYDEAGDRLFVTGKRWPLLFEIELVPVK